MQEINHKDISDIAHKEFALVYVYAPWCSTCESFKEPMEKEIAPQLEANGIHSFKMNAMDNAEYVKSLEMESIPFMAIYHNGNYIGGDSMTTPESLNEFVQMVHIFKANQNA